MQNNLYHIRHKTHLGWTAYNFLDKEEARETALGLESDVFFCPQRIKPASVERLTRGLTSGNNELCPVNSDIESYRYLIVDIDPVRPSGTSASDEQKSHAETVAREVINFFNSLGVKPHLWTSGNGFYVLVEIDLPASERPLIKSILDYLSRFDTEFAKVDQTTDDQAQLIRYPDTWNRKGTLHRRCEVLEVGNGILTEQQLRDLVPTTPTTTQQTTNTQRTPEWVEEKTTFFRDMLNENGVGFSEKEKSVDGQPALFFELSRCPFKEHMPTQQGGPFIAVTQARGTYGGCHHDECHGKKLAKLLQKIDPKYKTRVESLYLRDLDGIDNPRRIADKVREKFTLVRKDEVFFRFDGVFKRLDKSDVNAAIENTSREMFVAWARFLQDHGLDAKTIPVKSSLVNDVRLALSATVRSVGEAPCNVDDGKPLNDRLFFANGHIAINDAIAGNNNLEPYTAREFITHKLSVDYSPNPPSPRLWLQTLDEIFPSDPESIRLLQQFFGYALTQDVSEQKILVMVGRKRAGKGLCCRILTELVGDHNVSSSFLPSLGSSWGLDGLLGKSLLFIPEARNSEFSKGTTADILKAISGGDVVRIERRYEHSVSAVLPIKIIVVSNNLLTFDDVSGVIFSRFLTLNFQQTFYGCEDKRRFEKLQNELPGIMRWSLEGLRDLKENGFAEPATGKQLAQEMELQSNPALSFADEFLTEDPLAIESTSKVWGVFVDWCLSKDINPPSRMTFTAQIKSRGIKTANRTKSNNMHFLGVRLQTEVVNA